jgi:hypothetical protein
MDLFKFVYFIEAHTIPNTFRCVWKSSCTETRFCLINGVLKQESRLRVLSFVVVVHAPLLCFRNRLSSSEVRKLVFRNQTREC